MSETIHHVQLEEESSDENELDVTTTTSQESGNKTLVLEISDSLRKQSLAHERATKDCVGILDRVKIVAVVLSFGYFLRSNIFVLYAKTLDNYSNESVVGIVVYCSYVVSGTFSVIFGILGTCNIKNTLISCWFYLCFHFLLVVCYECC